MKKLFGGSLAERSLAGEKQFIKIKVLGKSQ